MQEVYDNFNKMSDADFKSWMLNTDLLDKEKEVITDAYVVGEREWLMEYEGGRDAYSKRAAYKYYNETFKAKEI